MAAFSLEDGMVTVTLSTCCALRMRVSISAMGSLMLIIVLLPAGLGDAGYFTLHRHFAKFVASQAELAEHATRATRNHAAIALAGGVGVARQLLQLEPSLVTFFVGLRLIVDDRLQFGALGG